MPGPTLAKPAPKWAPETTTMPEEHPVELPAKDLDLAPSVNLLGQRQKSLDLSALGTTFAGLPVCTAEGKEVGKARGYETAHDFEHEASFGAMPSLSATVPEALISAIESAKDTPRPCIHPSTSFPTMHSPMVERIGLNGVPRPTHGLDIPMAALLTFHSASELVASSPRYSGMPRPPHIYPRMLAPPPPTSICTYPLPDYGGGLPGVQYTSPGELKDPPSVKGRSWRSRISSQKPLTHSEL